jgi:hypothetical protein
MDTQSTSRALLIGVIVCLIVLVAVLLWNLAPLLSAQGSTASRPQAVHRGVTSAVMLPDAFLRAQARAADWAGDAYLVRAEAAWYIAEEWTRVEAPQVAWAFTYFSPAAASLASVVINDSATLWVPPFEVTITPTPLGDALPAHGVETAWLSFRAAGGDAFLTAHPGSQVTFRLQQRDGRPTWSVSAFGDGDFMEIRIDAQSGVVSRPDP